MTCKGGIAGSTFSVSYLAKGLAEKGHKVFLGCTKDSMYSSLLKDVPVEIIYIPFTSKIDSVSMKIVRDLIRKEKIDIVNAQMSRDRYISIFSRWLYGLDARVVHTRRQIPNSSGGFIHGWFYTVGTHRLVAVSAAVKKALMKMSIPDRHIEVIYNGTPREKYDVIDNLEVSRLRKNLGITESDKVIGVVSRDKKQDQVLKSLPMLDKDVKVIFAGIERTEKYTRIIDSLELKNEIHFLGDIKYPGVLNYYPLFNVSVLASITEGLSQALLESMAVGIPVIGTDAAGNPELIRDGENGYLFEDNNIEQLAAKLKKILDCRDTAGYLAANGKKTALEDFSIERTVANYETFFERLVAGN